MKCKSCKREIADNSIYCNWCGVRQIRDKKAVKVPAPRQLPSGSWNIYLRAEGQSVTEATPELCTAKAQAIRAGFVEKQKSVRVTLSAAIDRYIEDKQLRLSPSTIRGYRKIQELRFKGVMDRPISSVTNWQKVVNEEAAFVSPKTLKNAWGFVRSVLSREGMEVSVELPPVPKAERPWLTPEQIPTFLEAIKGKPCELAALLALHGLRRSELLGLDWNHIDLAQETLTVRNTRVVGVGEKVVDKPLTKTEASTRTIPFLIPALKPLLAAQPDKTGLVLKEYPNTHFRRINNICEAAGLPAVGMHGLRHSFASLGYHLKLSELEIQRLGGWADYQTVHKIYLHLSQADRDAAAEKLTDYFTHGILNESKKR